MPIPVLLSAEVNMQAIFTQLGEGFLTTGAIFFLTLVLSMPLGLLVAFGRMSKIKPLSWLTRFFYQCYARDATDAATHGGIFCARFLIVKLNWEVTLPDNYRFIATIVGFVLNYAAYFAEIYRGGIESMPVGQYEAAQVLGFTRSQTFLRIILPQVAKNILPSVTNEIITLVKDTSLAFSISVVEMFTAAKMLATSQSSVIPFFVAGVFYYIANYVVAFIMERVEKSLNYYK